SRLCAPRDGGGGTGRGQPLGPSEIGLPDRFRGQSIPASFVPLPAPHRDKCGSVARLAGGAPWPRNPAAQSDLKPLGFPAAVWGGELPANMLRVRELIEFALKLDAPA